MASLLFLIVLAANVEGLFLQIALLKILLAAAKSKTDSINILVDVTPEDVPTSVLQTMQLGIDVNRHKVIR